jgi:hypothetical protein
MTLKQEYDDYKSNNDKEEMDDFLGGLGDDSEDDEDDGLDDFFGSLGISRPK